MKTLILTISLVLIASLQAEDLPVEQEETQTVSETWYLKAVATDKPFPAKTSVSVTPMTIKILEGGNVELKLTMLARGRCHNLNITLEKTDEPGKYTAFRGNRVVLVTPSSMQDHYIFYSEDKWPRHRRRMVQLIGKDPEAHQEALADFKTVVESRGLHLDSIFIPKQSASLMPTL
ncbi:von Ebner gland protein 1 [Cavia porcellus]|uniref:von Ebner gland protein 1 n=1 Tax=Cavia porcellus TaxID=10141 RepID=UPI00022B5B28